MITLIYTTDMKDWLVGGTIRFACKWNRSHDLIAFHKAEKLSFGGTGDYFESIHKVDSVTGKNGVRGPITLDHLWEWVNEDPENRPLTMQPIPWFTEIDENETREKCIRSTSVITYPAIRRQLLYNLKMLMSGYRYGIAPRNRNSTQWDCSELVARVFPKWFVVVVMHLGDWLYEEYVPGAVRGSNPGYGPGLYQMIEEYRMSNLIKGYMP